MNKTEKMTPLEFVVVTPSVNIYSSWLKIINRGISEVNRLIEKYNSAYSIDEKKLILQHIENTQQNLDDTLPDTIVSYFDPYVNLFYDNLFLQLQEQKKYFSPQATHLPSETVEYFSDLLSTMDYCKAGRVLEILLAGKEADIGELARLYEPLDSNYDAYQSFLEQHTIQFLAGKNSKNFVIENKQSGSKYILKVENRIDATKEVERTLRRTLNKYPNNDNFLVEVYAERRVLCGLSGSKLTATLVFMNYCEGKTLTQLATIPTSIEERIELGIEIGLAHLKLVKKTQDMNVVNTDYKGDNLFFVRDSFSSELIATVADCKAFCAAQDGFFIPPWDSRAITSGVLGAPEIVNKEIIRGRFRVEPIHLYTVAKNIFMVLAADDDEAISTSLLIPGFIDLLFTSPLFTTIKGQVLKDLLMKLGRFNPDDRLSLDEAMNILKGLKYGQFYTNINCLFARYKFDCELPTALLDSYIDMVYCRFRSYKDDPTVNWNQHEQQADFEKALEKLHAISLLSFGKHDRIMQQFIQSTLFSLLSETDHKQTLGKIDRVQQSLGPLVQFIHGLCQRLRQKNHVGYFSTKLKQEKGDLIENQMRRLPLCQREYIFLGNEYADIKNELKHALARRTVAMNTWFKDLEASEVCSLDYQKALEIYNKCHADVSHPCVDPMDAIEPIQWMEIA